MLAVIDFEFEGEIEDDLLMEGVTIDSLMVGVQVGVVLVDCRTVEVAVTLIFGVILVDCRTVEVAVALIVGLVDFRTVGVAVTLTVGVRANLLVDEEGESSRKPKHEITCPTLMEWLSCIVGSDPMARSCSRDPEVAFVAASVTLNVTETLPLKLVVHGSTEPVCSNI